MWPLLALLPQQLSLQMLSLLAWSRRQRRSHQGAAPGWGCGRSLAMVRSVAPSQAVKMGGLRCTPQLPCCGTGMHNRHLWRGTSWAVSASPSPAEQMAVLFMPGCPVSASVAVVQNLMATHMQS